jgi:hypothetical protein
MGLLAAHPDISLDHPDGLLYDAVEAAELGEPGALAALIDLKLSNHVQFQDRTGGCRLVQEAQVRALPESGRWRGACPAR